MKIMVNAVTMSCEDNKDNRNSIKISAWYTTP